MKTLPSYILVLLITSFPLAIATAQVAGGGGAGGIPGTGSKKPVYKDRQLIPVITKRADGTVGYCAGAYIDLKNPDKSDDEGYGTVLLIPAAASKKTNAHGTPYGYGKVDIQKGFRWEIKNHFGPGKHHTGDVTELKRYWNWVYSNYKKVSPEPDFSMNCHGYAFDVGDWPYTAVELLAEGPFPAGSKLKPLYKRTPAAQWARSTIAVDGKSTTAMGSAGVAHSMKIDGTAGKQGGVTKHASIYSIEKFRESGIYSQQTDWPKDVFSLKKSKRTSQMSFLRFEPN